MHPEVSSFIQAVSVKHPKYFNNTDVLEVGSLDINGSIRGLFQANKYVGLDVGEGPGVDVVTPIHQYFNEDGYDVVVSTEMLEHDRYWRESLRSMLDNLKKGGILILTCAGPSRQEHGTTATTPGDAPFTTDYYKNISIEDFSSVLPSKLFKEYYITYTRGEADLYFYGIKG